MTRISLSTVSAAALEHEVLGFAHCFGHGRIPETRWSEAAHDTAQNTSPVQAGPLGTILSPNKRVRAPYEVLGKRDPSPHPSVTARGPRRIAAHNRGDSPGPRS